MDPFILTDYKRETSLKQLIIDITLLAFGFFSFSNFTANVKRLLDGLDAIWRLCFVVLRKVKEFRV